MSFIALHPVKRVGREKYTVVFYSLKRTIHKTVKFGRWLIHPDDPPSLKLLRQPHETLSVL
jgi:hypothetical protein